MKELFNVSTSPHIRSEETTGRLMADVVIALMPASIFGVYQFGLRALAIMLLSMLTCVATEFAWDKYITEENTREKLIEDWKANVSSPAHAAESGDIDDIISTNELRLRICSALLMLSAKGASCTRGRKVLPL